MLDISAIPHDAPLRIIIGAGNQSWPGWIATQRETQREQLDLSCPDDWVASFGDRRIDALLCEHVWEHLFHFTYWDPADGPIYRSLRSDHRNQDGKLRMASLIVDAKRTR